MAISPIDRHDWLMENILFFVFFTVLITTHKFFQFSTISYLLITIFFTLHLTGAHYTYSKVPFGFYLSELFDLQRNHFDRIVHFSFGLLLTYPIRELLIRYTKLNTFFSYYLPIDIILTCSAFFEILEWLFVLGVNPELGDAYLGTQGDIWDAQKDMALAAVGSVVAMGVVYLGRRIYK
jgi:putative membrane protein